MACEPRETEVEHLRLLASLRTQETAVGDVNTSTTGHLRHVEEHDAGDFVHEQDANHGNVQQQEKQHHGDQGRPECRFLDVRQGLDGVEAQGPTFFHDRGLFPVFRKGRNAVGMNEETGRSKHQNEADEGVDRHDGHGNEVDVDQQTDGLVPWRGFVALER